MENKTEKRKEAPARPMCLELAEAQADIMNAINAAVRNRKIPFYLLESIVNDAARQVTGFAKAERTQAKKLYEQQLDEYNRAEDAAKE